MVASIAPKDALEKLTSGDSTKTIYLDVRMPSEYQNGHPPNAVNVPVSLGGGKIVDSFVEDVKNATPSDANLIVGCKSGKRSSMAIDILSKDGAFEGRLTELEGGFDGWSSNSQLPVEKN